METLFREIAGAIVFSRRRFEKTAEENFAFDWKRFRPEISARLEARYLGYRGWK